MHTTLITTLASCLAITASALPPRSGPGNVAASSSSSKRVEGSSFNWKTCGSSQSPALTLSLNEKKPQTPAKNSNFRVLMSTNKNKDQETATLVRFPPLPGHRGCQLNFILPDPENFPKFQFLKTSRFEIFSLNDDEGKHSNAWRPSWNDLKMKSRVAWGEVNTANPGVQVVNVGDCAKANDFVVTVARDVQVGGVNFDQKNAIGRDGRSSVGFYRSFDC